MTSRFVYLATLAIWIALLWLGLDYAGRPKTAEVAVPTTHLAWPEFFSAYVLPSLPAATEFDTPLRPPDGNGAVISFPFLEATHLGEDWTTAKGDLALGEPVYSVADGWVSVAQNFEGAWSNAVFICYRLEDKRYPPFVEVMYAQLQSMTVKAGQFVKRGQQIGTVGNADGTYKAHLHWEVRQTVGLGVGPGFDVRRDGWLGPSEFLGAHRGDRASFPLLPKTLLKTERDGWGTDY